MNRKQVDAYFAWLAGQWQLESALYHQISVDAIDRGYTVVAIHYQEASSVSSFKARAIMGIDP